MLIRSQDKTALVKFENIVINLKLPESLRVICWSLQDAQRSGGYFVLGEYSTKEKSLKVLNMIQEAYTNEKVVERVAYNFRDVPLEAKGASDAIIKKMLLNSAVFQMPEDGSVEV